MGRRSQLRRSNGQWRKATGADFGIGGICPTPDCRHFLLRHYDGDPRQGIDPRKFVYRCFTCNPLTEDELNLKAEIEASQPKPKSLLDILEEATKEKEEKK
jgi:hypothetical protein